MHHIIYGIHSLFLYVFFIIHLHHTLLLPSYALILGLLSTCLMVSSILGLKTPLLKVFPSIVSLSPD